ncbi:MAG: hypothetical protein JWO82_2685 [Akkermansiaceae bacterium]|nr:hypothetical protein [Akkermansiaceae bacterium]
MRPTGISALRVNKAEPGQIRAAGSNCWPFLRASANHRPMKLTILPVLLASVMLVAGASAKMPAAKSANLVSSFGNAPLNEGQLKTLNEILAVSMLSAPPPVEIPAAPARTTTKPSKIKPAKRAEPAKPVSGETRTIETMDAQDHTLSLTVDLRSGTFKNLNVPAAQAGKVKELLASLNLSTDGKGR